MNSFALIAFTQRGCMLATALAEGLRGAAEYAGAQVSVCGPERYADTYGVQSYKNLSSWTAEHFSQVDALVYVGACGIAVRAIAPHVRDKFTDPAVISVDEAGSFVVPLLSGHVGGANELAREIARIVGGQAVVSTATDVNKLFAVDEWAARNNMSIVERVRAKEVSACLLEGGTVGYWTDCWPAWELPAGVVDATALDPARVPGLGFAVSLDDTCSPFERTLHLVPRTVTVGVGCRRDTEPAVLEQHVDAVLSTLHVSQRAVTHLASIDVKSDEPAILELARSRGWEPVFYSADELNAVLGEFEGSEFVKRTVGVDNVCERAALAQGGRLLCGKQAKDGTTVAVAIHR